MEILTKNFVVYGTGSSGKSAVSFLLSRGAKNVYIFDDYNSTTIEHTFNLNKFEHIRDLDISCVILSPGVQIVGNKNIEFLKKNKIPFVSEFSLGFNFVKGKTICITGTNGKTTTVNLVYEMLKTKYKDVFLCGNTKIPITEIVNQTKDTSITICEVSSFALECGEIKPDVSAILNISCDHINRHKNFENYKKTKLKITKNQTFNDIFVCKDDFIIRTNAKVITYSMHKKTDCVHFFDNYVWYQNKKIINQKQIKLVGEKNIENILCAVSIAKILGVKNLKIKKVLKSFTGLKHRLQVVLKKNKITFIDDSKATNPDSTICALSCFKKNVILLLGGSDKGYDYSCIFDNVYCVKKIVAFGEMGDKIVECAINHNYANIAKFSTLKDATQYAISIALAGDIVLLSPACASFDEFSSYAERGDVFCKLVCGEYEKTKN